MLWLTASEPNLLKIRLKQSVIERKTRIGPLAARRHERLLHAAQRRQQKQNSALASTYPTKSNQSETKLTTYQFISSSSKLLLVSVHIFFFLNSI